MIRLEMKRTHGGVARVAMDSDLMLNQMAASALETTEPLGMAFDHLGNPMVFTVGSKRSLNVIFQKEGTATGWQLVDLTAGLGENLEVSAFQVAQDQSGSLRLAVAAHPKGQSEEDKLWLTDALPNTLTDQGWTSGNPGWNERPFSGSHRISHILLGTEDDGKGTPLMIAATVKGNIRGHYVVNTQLNDPSWMWQPFQIPQNASKDFVDMAIGTIQGERGVYSLYDTATGRALTFTTLPDGRMPGDLYYDFPLPGVAAIEAITTLPQVPQEEDDDDWFGGGDAGESFDLFVAGKGVYLYEGSKTTQPPVCLAEGTEVQAAQSIYARMDAQNIALWMVEKTSGRLQYILGRKEAGERLWHTPIPLRQGIAQFAAVRNPKRQANEMVLAGKNGVLVHLWQDPITTGWRESEIPVPAIDDLHEFESYTSVINFQVASAEELVNSNIQITASDWVRVVINGVTFTLSPDVPVQVSMDVGASLTIIQRADGIQPPIYRIKADFISEPFELNPGQKILTGLESIDSGKALDQAQRRNGKPVISGNVDPNTLEEVSSVLGELTSLARDGLGEDRSGVGYRAGGGQRIGAVDGRRLNRDMHWGVRFDNRGKPAFTQSIHGASQPGGARQGLAHVGDFFESLTRGMLEVTSFVVKTIVDGAKKVIQFVFEVAGRLFQFYIETLGHVFDAIYWFLKEKLGIDLAVVLEWLGQLFNWEEIKATQQVMVDMANRCLDYGAAGLDVLADKVDAFFIKIKNQVLLLKPGTMPAGGGQRIFATGKASSNPAVNLANLPTPMATWTQYHIKHGNFSVGRKPKLQPTDPLMRFFNETLVGLLDTVQDTMTSVVGECQRAFEQGNVSADQLLAAIGTDVLVGLVDLVRQIAVGVLRLLADLVRLLREMVNVPLDLPVITSLYKGIYKNPKPEELPYADMSLLNGVAFLVAAPTTWISKMVTGKAPFGSGIQPNRDAEYSRILNLLPGLS